MKVNLHIDRLVLDGVALDAADRPRFDAELRAELSRLIGENGLSHEISAGGALPSLRVPAIAIGDPSPRPVAASIARSLYGGLGGRR